MRIDQAAGLPIGAFRGVAAEPRLSPPTPLSEIQLRQDTDFHMFLRYFF